MRYPLALCLYTALCGAGAFTLSPALLAQDAVEAQPDATAGDEIIVETERQVDIRAASELAREVAGRPQAREPLARLTAPLCLQLAIDDNAFGLEVGRRIIANARTAKIKIGEPGCQPNALVIIADDMREKLEERRKIGRRFFGRLKRHDINRAMRVRDPVYVFQDVERTVSIARGRLDRVVRKDTISTAVMMEKGAIAGMTAEQVADYATLRLLAPTRETTVLADGAPNTIMTLYSAPGERPSEMTPFDRAYLAALYRLRFDATAKEVLVAAARSLDNQ